MLLNKNATVTIAHSKTKNIKEKCQKDLIVNEMILNNIKSGHFLYRQKLKKNIKILKDITKTN